MFKQIIFLALCASIFAEIQESSNSESLGTDTEKSSESNIEAIKQPFSNEFSNKINWTSFEDAFNLAKETNKPIMLIIHKSWCTACGILKQSFATNESQIIEASKDFIMVHNKDDESEPKSEDDRFTPDGSYIPRVLFYDTNGNLLRNMINEEGEHKPKFLYFHPNVSTVIKTMSRTKEYLASKIPTDSTKNEL